MIIFNKLFKSSLEIFLVKRLVLIFFVVLPIIFFVKTDKVYIVCGLATGTVYSCFRLKSMAGFYFNVLGSKNSSNAVTGSVINYLLSLVVLMLILIASIRFNIVLFASIIAGVLTLPFAIILNSITEVLGITHNNFE